MKRVCCSIKIIIACFLLLGAKLTFADQFTDGLAAIAGKGGTIASNDAFVDTKRLAPGIAKHYPATEWEAIYPQEAADFIEFLDKDRVLVGTVEVGAYLGVPDHKQVILYDAKTGKTIWQARRESLPRGAYTVLTTGPLIVLAGVDEDSTYFTALDPASGEQRWQYTAKASCRFRLTDKLNQILLLSSGKSGHKLDAIDTATGKIRWSNNQLPADLFDKLKQADIFMGKDAVYLVGRKLAGFSLKTGKLLWSAQHAALKNKSRSARYTNKGILLWDKKNLLLLSSRTGKTLWANPLKNTKTKFIAYLDNRILRVAGKKSSRSGSIDNIQAINPTNGKSYWTKQAGGALMSPLALHKGVLIYTTDATLVGLKATNGKQQFKQKLPAGFRKNSPSKSGALAQPDIIHLSSGKLYVAREFAGIAAYSLPHGKLRWQQRIYPMGIDIYGASAQYLSMLFSMDIHGHRVSDATKKAEAFSFHSAYPNPTLQATQSSIMASLQQQKIRHRKWNQSTRLYRFSNEAGGNQMADFNGARGVLNASIDLAAAVELMLKETAVEGLLLRHLLQIQASFQMYKNSFQGQYYLRPFSNEHGRGITLVDLNTGKRNDLVFSPPIMVLRQYGLDMQSFAIDPKNNRLLTVGVGLNTNNYQEYVKWKWRMPRPSLLAYRLNSLKFTKDNLTAKLVVRQKLLADATPAALLAYAAGGNIESVEILLGEGLDVNSQGPTQQLTPLMMATIQAQTLTVKHLIKHGAKVNLASKRGMTALDFSRSKQIRKGVQKDTPAYAKKYKAIEKLLLAAGAKAGVKQTRPKSMKANKPNLALHQSTKLVANAGGGNIKVVKEMLSSGVDVNIRYAAGGNMTALMMAVVLQKEEMVRLLLEHGANPKLKNDDSMSAMDMARNSKNEKIINMLNAAK